MRLFEIVVTWLGVAVPAPNAVTGSDVSEAGDSWHGNREQVTTNATNR